MHMNVIQKQRKLYAVLLIVFVLLFITSLCLTFWFNILLMAEVAVIFGLLDVILIFFLVRVGYFIHDANLIWENCILAVPSAVILISGSKEKREVEEVVVSTFGLLIGRKIYKWGCDGVYGVRLSAVEIDRTRMHLTFGDENKNILAVLLHGMVDKETVMDVKHRLWSETGVMAEIHGWQ
jgi:hypothetical protein